MRLKEEQLRREEEKVSHLYISKSFSYNSYFTVARDRVACPTRDQREETGIACKGRITQVGCRYLTLPGRHGSWSAHAKLFTDVIMCHRNLESRLAAQGSQADFRE